MTEVQNHQGSSTSDLASTRPEALDPQPVATRFAPAAKLDKRAMPTPAALRSHLAIQRKAAKLLKAEELARVLIRQAAQAPNSPLAGTEPTGPEDDDDVRVLPHGPNYMTPQCFSALHAERDQLRKEERPRVVHEVAEAAAMGDRSENAEYIYGKRRLREIDSRVRFLDGRLDKAQVIDPAKTTKRDRVYFGATVVVEGETGDRRRWTLVGEDEVQAGAGRISYRSPIGAALLGRGVDDEVSVRTPSGIRSYCIAEITYP